MARGEGHCEGISTSFDDNHITLKMYYRNAHGWIADYEKKEPIKQPITNRGYVVALTALFVKADHFLTQVQHPHKREEEY